MPPKPKARREAESYAWWSLIISAIVAVMSFSGGLPILVVQVASVTGSLFFLYGPEKHKGKAIVAMMIAGFIEAASAVALLVIGFVLLSNPAYGFGWGVLIGVYALIGFVFVAAVATLDLLAAFRARSWLYGSAETVPVREVGVPSLELLPA